MVTSGTAPMKFIWMKDGKELAEAGNVRFKQEQGYSMLFFEPVDVNSGGNYTCVVKNRAGMDSYTTFLDVEEVRQAWENLRAGEEMDIARVTLNETGRYQCTAANGVEPGIRHILFLSIYGAPKIQPFSFPNRLKVFGRTSVMCTAADGTQPFTFSWLKDGASVRGLKNVREEKKGGDYSVLIIEPVEALNAGNYTCIVKNKAGFDSHTAYLEVEAPPTWKSVPGNSDIVKGENLTLSCKAHGSPPPKITWLFKQEGASGQTMQDLLSSRASAFPNGSLVFHELDIKDSGQYTCSADNGVAPALKKTVTLKINVALSIHCLISFTKVASLHFRRPPQILKADQNGSMIIQQLETQDAGQYVCEADNGINPALKKTISVKVTASPTWRKVSGDILVVLGRTVVIECAAAGFPQPTLSFRKTGDKHVVINSTSSHNGTLLIDQVSIHDAGQYVCEADNGIAPIASHSFTVAVNGAAGEISLPVSNSRMRISQNGTLLIEEVAPDDAAKYICRADNGIGSVSHSLYLHVRGMTRYPNTKPTRAQRRVSLFRQAAAEAGVVALVDSFFPTSHKLRQCGWPLARSPLGRPGEDCQGPSVSDRVLRHVISTVERRQRFLRHLRAEIVMRCIPTHPSILLAVAFITANATEEVPPALQEIISSTKVKAGERATGPHAYCSHGSAPLTFQWLKSGMDASLLPNVRVTQFEDYLLLVLNPASADSSGNYTCAATNALGSDTLTTHIEVSDGTVGVVYIIGRSVSRSLTNAKDILQIHARTVKSQSVGANSDRLNKPRGYGGVRCNDDNFILGNFNPAVA
ncbi:hypothetical protein HPB48_008192 [Haemaphysalis longicornis]|uniref:Ig-like domain-containing protein n=1 Tax=Haemaphysalis longicornis TaxID=44386 RepID=A0A9J6GZV5_HAELO|nr:hypothetical protein HPB48_008192 [Haemaphysalis longicornis]